MTSARRGVARHHRRRELARGSRCARRSTRARRLITYAWPPIRGHGAHRGGEPRGLRTDWCSGRRIADTSGARSRSMGLEGRAAAPPCAGALGFRAGGPWTTSSTARARLELSCAAPTTSSGTAARRARRCGCAADDPAPRRGGRVCAALARCSTGPLLIETRRTRSPAACRLAAACPRRRRPSAATSPPFLSAWGLPRAELLRFAAPFERALARV